MKHRYEFDEETLECPLCNEFLSSPIHQCENGHMACSACCEKLKGKECPTCRAMPFAHSRSLGMEKIILSLRSTCVHAPDGCTEMLKLTEKDKHAREACEYRQLKCPVPTCSHMGPKLKVPEHFKSVHNIGTVRFPQGTISQSRRFDVPWNSLRQHVLFAVDKELFLVHVRIVPHVSLPVKEWDCQHSIIMFSGSSFGNDSLRYNLKITLNGKEGVSSTSGLYHALAVNNQKTANNWEDRNLILLPHVNPRAESTKIVLQLTLL